MSAPSGVTYSFLSVYARGKLGASLWSLWRGPRRGMSRQGTKQTRMGTKQTREGTKQTHMDPAASHQLPQGPTRPYVWTHAFWAPHSSTAVTRGPPSEDDLGQATAR